MSPEDASGCVPGLDGRVALITGAARRLGAEDARALHAAGARVLVHYRNSRDEAEALVASLNASRPDSARLIGGHIGTRDSAEAIVEQALSAWQRLDILVNNASAFYPTPLGSITEAAVEELFASNLTGPLFLAQAAMPALTQSGGSIINMIDTHAVRPLREHTTYCAAKAGLAMLTRSLALELAPHIRVNGIAPGVILWPEAGEGPDDNAQRDILAGVPLQRSGTPADIARLVVFLASDAANYITGQIIAVDGGRLL